MRRLTNSIPRGMENVRNALFLAQARKEIVLPFPMSVHVKNIRAIQALCEPMRIVFPRIENFDGLILPDLFHSEGANKGIVQIALRAENGDLAMLGQYAR